MPRGPLPESVEKAARSVSSDVWGSPYVPGDGVMHYAGGPWWTRELRRRARRWRSLAQAADVCADWLGDGEFPGDET